MGFKKVKWLIGLILGKSTKSRVTVKDETQLTFTRGKHRSVQKNTKVFESERLDSRASFVQSPTKASELNDCDWY